MDAYEVVEQHWPYDGPHSDETVEQAATAVGQLVRYLSNATWPYKRNVASGPTLYRVLSSMNSSVYGLRQLLEQLQTTAVELADDESMYDDRRDRPARGTAVDAAAALGEALVALAPLIRAVEHASSLTCHLGHEETRKGSSR